MRQSLPSRNSQPSQFCCYCWVSEYMWPMQKKKKATGVEERKQHISTYYIICKYQKRFLRSPINSEHHMFTWILFLGNEEMSPSIDIQRIESKVTQHLSFNFLSHQKVRHSWNKCLLFVSELEISPQAMAEFPWSRDWQ